MQESTKHTPFSAMFQRMARLPIDITEDRFADPDERLAHYKSSAVEKDEEIAAKERSDLLSAIKAKDGHHLISQRATHEEAKDIKKGKMTYLTVARYMYVPCTAGAYNYHIYMQAVFS